MATLHVWVEGLVQGVFFRDSTRHTAMGLGLTGWVKNLHDGRVEAKFQGERGACEKALEYVRVGPPSASVEHVTHQWEADEETFTGFRILF
jgi:acylphosphatase